MGKWAKNQSGMTLIEIILALALLGIIMIGFLPVFVSGFFNLTAEGNRSRANIDAQKVMDRIYEEARFSDLAGLEADVETILTDIAGAGNFENCTDDIAAFDLEYDGSEIRFIVSESELLADAGTPTVTLKVFYQNGKRFIVLTSPIVNGSQ